MSHVTHNLQVGRSRRDCFCMPRSDAHCVDTHGITWDQSGSKDLKESNKNENDYLFRIPALSFELHPASPASSSTGGRKSPESLDAS